MVALLDQLTTGDGLRPSCLDGVSFGRATQSHPRSPVLYEPSIYIVARGRKIGFIGDRRLTYDANNYLVLAAPLPFECQTEAGPDGPMLDLPPGHYTYSITLPGAPPARDEVAVAEGEAWALVIGPGGGAMPLHMY